MTSSRLEGIHRELAALYTLCRRLSLQDLARELKSQEMILSRNIAMGSDVANQTLKAAVGEQHWEQVLSSMRDAVAKEAQANADRNAQGGFNITQQQRALTVLEQMARSMGTNLSTLMAQAQSPVSSLGMGPTLGGTTSSSSPMQSPSMTELARIVSEWRSWKEEKAVAAPSLERVFMRQCPCCGSEVFFDRENDAVITIDPEAGYIKIRLKNGQMREVRVAEAVLEP